MVQRNVFVILERWGDELAITTYSTKRKAQAKFDDIAKRLKQGAQTNKKIFENAERNYLQVEQITTNDTDGKYEVTYQLDLITKNLL